MIQRHIDSLGSPIRLPEYRSPISTPANNNIDESTSPFIAAMNTTVDNALRELKDTLASKVHPSAAAVKSISPYRKHKTVHTSPMESNFHYPPLHSATATDHMMASMADLMKAVGGIISHSNTDRKRSHSPHSHRRRRERFATQLNSTQQHIEFLFFESKMKMEKTNKFLQLYCSAGIVEAGVGVGVWAGRMTLLYSSSD